MVETSTICEQSVCAAEMKQLGRLLHDLCQPLTTLQCLIEMATLTGTDASYRQLIDLGGAECLRAIDRVNSMRETLRSALREIDRVAAEQSKVLA